MKDSATNDMVAKICLQSTKVRQNNNEAGIRTTKGEEHGAEKYKDGTSIEESI